MRKHSVATLVALALSGFLPASAEITDSPNIQPPPGTRIITTTGIGRLMTKPDQVLIVLGVKTWNKDLRAGYTDAEATINRIMTVANKFKIPAKNVQTSEFQITPARASRSSLGDDGKPNGYYVLKEMSVVISEMQTVPAFISDAVDAGANEVSRIELQISNSRTLRDQARIMALKAAREKAVGMAAVFNGKVGKPIIIKEGASGITAADAPTQTYSRMNSINQANTDTEPDSEKGIAVGQLRVDSTVIVTFELTD